MSRDRQLLLAARPPSRTTRDLGVSRELARAAPRGSLVALLERRHARASIALDLPAPRRHAASSSSLRALEADASRAVVDRADLVASRCVADLARARAAFAASELAERRPRRLGPDGEHRGRRRAPPRSCRRSPPLEPLEHERRRRAARAGRCRPRRSSRSPRREVAVADASAGCGSCSGVPAWPGRDRLARARSRPATIAAVRRA